MYRPHHWLNLSEILTADVLRSKDPGQIFGWKSDKDQGQGHHFCKYHIMGHYFWTGSRRNFWLVGKHSLQNGAYVSYPQILTYDVTFLRHVTSNKMNNFEKKNSTNCQGQRSNWRSRSNKGQRSRSFNFFHYFVCYQCDIVEFMKHGNRLLQSSIFNRSFSKLIHIMFGPIRCNLQKNVTYVPSDFDVRRHVFALRHVKEKIRFFHFF